MRALVVGASGFVGNYLVEHLLGMGDEVVAATFGGAVRRREASPVAEDLFASKVTSVALDITNVAECTSVMQRFHPQVVYHLAGIAFVPEAEADFERALLVNVNGVANIVRQCYLASTPIPCVFVSSAEVYGTISPSELPLKESTPVRPGNNYSLTKRMAELVCERYSRSGALKVVIARPFNHIGAGQDSRFVVSSFALQLARIARGVSAPVLEVGNLEAKRDFSDVRDVVRAYRLMSEGGSGVYNLGSGRARSIQSILDTLIEISGMKVTVRTDPTRMRGPEVPELVADCAKARSELGWTPEFDLDESLRAVYDYWFTRLGEEGAV